MSLSPQAQLACERYFGGNVAMFTSYRDGCRERFAADALAGDAALAAQAWVEFKLLVHSLKTVLRMLGHDAASELAAQLETEAVQADKAPLQALWPGLRGTLNELARG